MRQDVIKWTETVLIGGLGGGIASSIAALADPSKYSFPKDLGTGKMWPFFLSGSAMTIGALLLKSPLGSKVVAQIKDSQSQLQESKQTIQQTKSDLKKQP